ARRTPALLMGPRAHHPRRSPAHGRQRHVGLRHPHPRRVDRRVPAQRGAVRQWVQTRPRLAHPAHHGGDPMRRITLTRIAYTIPEASDATGISESTIRAAIADGVLIASYVGERATKPVLRAVELDAWIESLP